MYKSAKPQKKLQFHDNIRTLDDITGHLEGIRTQKATEKIQFDDHILSILQLAYGLSTDRL